VRQTIIGVTLTAATFVAAMIGQADDRPPDDAAAAMQTTAAIIEATLSGQDATPVTIAANDGDYIYDIPHDQPLAVEVIEATQTRDGARVAYIVFVRDGAGFVKLGPFEFDATTGTFKGAIVDSELFLAPVEAE
jgi:hypothetical protein